eukprot:SAG11_NODE_17362_length_520_cov_2.990499_1_plen_97_part_00
MDLAPDVGGTRVPATMAGEMRNLGPIMAGEMRDLEPIIPDFVYELFHSTWEPESSLSGTARRMLQEYKKSHALDSSPEGGGSASKRPRKADKTLSP